VLARDLQRFTTPQEVQNHTVTAVVTMVPGAEDATITVAQQWRDAGSAAASSERAGPFDVLQSQTGQGPCRDALFEQQTVRVTTWPTINGGRNSLPECRRRTRRGSWPILNGPAALTSDGLLGGLPATAAVTGATLPDAGGCSWRALAAAGGGAGRVLVDVRDAARLPVPSAKLGGWCRRCWGGDARPGVGGRCWSAWSGSSVLASRDDAAVALDISVAF
jgi:hypothetical protein